jgi:hypothetical protein
MSCPQPWEAANETARIYYRRIGLNKTPAESNDRRSSCHVDDEDIPNSFLRLPEAVAVLIRGMYATFQQPKPVHKIKLDHQKASVVFGPWKEHAAQRIRAAVCDGELPLYVRSNADLQPVLLHPNVIGRLMAVRGGLPEHPIRPSLKTVYGDTRLLKLLSSGRLLLCRHDFEAWYKSERRKGRWPSQRLRNKRRGGRPSKITASLRKAVADALGKRRGSIAELRRRLIASGRTDVPSADTLERLVDQLHRETGRPEFYRFKRSRRRRPGVR